MIKESVRPLAERARKTNQAFTELEDGSILMSPEQINTLLRLGKEAGARNMVDFVLGMIVSSRLTRGRQ